MGKQEREAFRPRGADVHTCSTRSGEPTRLMERRINQRVRLRFGYGGRMILPPRRGHEGGREHGELELPLSYADAKASGQLRQPWRRGSAKAGRSAGNLICCQSAGAVAALRALTISMMCLSSFYPSLCPRLFNSTLILFLSIA